MNEANRVWVIPNDPNDMAPLPALLRDGPELAFYDRKQKCFGNFVGPMNLAFGSAYGNFEDCRAAMIEARIEALKGSREHCNYLANSIEHIRTIPAAPFPDVQREVREAQQQEQAQAEGQKEQGQKQQEEVRPAPKQQAAPRRPARGING